MISGVKHKINKIIGLSGDTFSRRVISQLKSGNSIGLNASPFFCSGLVLGRRIPLLVGSKTISFGIVVVELSGSKVVYLYVNREREFWCSTGKTVIPARPNATLAAAERILPATISTVVIPALLSNPTFSIIGGDLLHVRDIILGGL
jgi:hypothetical protein